MCPRLFLHHFSTAISFPLSLSLAVHLHTRVSTLVSSPLQYCYLFSLVIIVGSTFAYTCVHACFFSIHCYLFFSVIIVGSTSAYTCVHACFFTTSVLLSLFPCHYRWQYICIHVCPRLFLHQFSTAISFPLSLSLAVHLHTRVSTLVSSPLQYCYLFSLVIIVGSTSAYTCVHACFFTTSVLLSLFPCHYRWQYICIHVCPRLFLHHFSTAISFPLSLSLAVHLHTRVSTLVSPPLQYCYLFSLVIIVGSTFAYTCVHACFFTTSVLLSLFPCHYRWQYICIHVCPRLFLHHFSTAISFPLSLSLAVHLHTRVSTLVSSAFTAISFSLSLSLVVHLNSRVSSHEESGEDIQLLQMAPVAATPCHL